MCHALTHRQTTVEEQPVVVYVKLKTETVRPFHHSHTSGEWLLGCGRALIVCFVCCAEHCPAHIIRTNTYYHYKLILLLHFILLSLVAG